MGENVLRNTAIAGLILLAGGQGLALWLRQEPAPAAGGRSLRAGDGLGELDLLDGRGSPVSWPPGGSADALLRRAPWVFVVDEGGSILAEGHDLGAPEVLAALTGAPGEGEGP